MANVDFDEWHHEALVESLLIMIIMQIRKSMI